MFKSSQTPLVDAVEAGDCGQVERLLLNSRSGIDTARKTGGETPLMLASFLGHAGVVNALLRAGAGVDVTNMRVQGFTPLMAASKAGNLAVVGSLLQAGAQPDVKNLKDGNTALVMACLKSDDDRLQNGNHLAVVEALLQAGADKNAKANNGATPLLNACLQGDVTVVDALLQAGVDLESVLYEVEYTALLVAAAQEFGAIVETLLRSGAEVNAQGKNDVTPLILASEKGNLEIVKLLLRSGADRTAVSIDGSTAAHLAKIHGHTDVALALLDEGSEEKKSELCSHCGKPAKLGSPKLRRCSRCLVACYCGRDCQKVAWKQHKKTCCLPKPEAETKTKQQVGVGEVQSSIDSSTCSVCLDAVKTHAFMPCGHMCFCGFCANTIIKSDQKSCPVCRATSEVAVQIFA